MSKNVYEMVTEKSYCRIRKRNRSVGKALGIGETRPEHLTE